MEINKARELIQAFEHGSLRKQIGSIEDKLTNTPFDEIGQHLESLEIDQTSLEAALSIKKIAGQINVIVHALGILLSLPYILEEGEVVQTLSLGAGNTGKSFDLETDRRVAEYKFIQWKGGAETIRKNQLFKDFFLLAKDKTQKRKYLYVIGKEYPLKFLNGKRALGSVLSRNKRVNSDFVGLYGDQYERVFEYYNDQKSKVEIVDLLEVFPEEISNLFIE